MTGRRGSVLILALWSLSLLTVFAVSLGVTARQKASLLDRIRTQSELESAALAGIAKASGLLKRLAVTDAGYDNVLSDWSAKTSYFKDIPCGRAFCTVRSGTKVGLRDENSKLPLNTAGQAALALLFKWVGELDSEQADALAFTVVDWRDPDPMLSHPQKGAEDRDYEELDTPYEAKDAPFQIIDELLLVKGFSRPIFDKIRPYVTASNTDHVNIHTAPKEVLIALGIEEKLCEKILLYRRGVDETEGTADDGFFPAVDRIVPILSAAYSLEDSEMASVSQLVSSGALGTTSTFFSATSVASIPDKGVEMELEAVWDKEGNTVTVRPGPIQWQA